MPSRRVFRRLLPPHYITLNTLLRAFSLHILHRRTEGFLSLTIDLSSYLIIVTNMAQTKLAALTGPIAIKSNRRALAEI